MTEYLDAIREKLDGQIDFHGQRLTEQISTNALAIIGLISFLTGYFTQNIQYSLYSMIAGSVLVFAAVIPPWPVYNRNPEGWLPSQADLAGMGLSFGGG